MQSNINDQEAQWIEMARGGDDEAFGKLVDAYQGPVFNLCYRILEDAREAEDAAQESFLRAYRNLHQYDASRKFVNWMLTIASNYSVDQVRKRHLKLLPLEKLPGTHQKGRGGQSLDERLIKTQTDREIRELLGTLSPIDRSAVVLRYWNDLSYEQISEVLELSVSAVRSRLHRSRKIMAESWGASAGATEIRGPSDEPSAI